MYFFLILTIYFKRT